MKLIRESFKTSLNKLKELDKDSQIVFLAVAVMSIISYYFTSRRFFRVNIQQFFLDSDYTIVYEFLYWLFGDFLNFTLISIIMILFIHKRKLSEFGFCLGEKKLGFQVVFLVIAISIPILWVVSSFESFYNFYPNLYLAKSNLKIFLIYEIGMLFYMFGWEFVWRGYMLFGLEKKFDWYAIYIQMIPFVILHNGKPLAETIGSIFAAIALGVLAFKTRTFIYGVIIHFAIMFIIDLFGFIRYNFHIFNIFN